MASRKLGGGRILGSGKGLAAPQTPAQQRPSSVLTPSDSTSSLLGLDDAIPHNAGTPLSVSPMRDHIQDITSRVNLDRSASPVPGTMPGKLVCPICAEEMMTLLQLNRHLDDNHQELPEVQQVEVQNWFEKQVVKAKKFQPLAVINQKLKGLDVFESNNGPVAAVTHALPPQAGRIPVPETRPPDPDEVVTRTHWQRHGHNDVCTEPACGKRLGPVNGTINCRHCGKLFCEDHTMYQMKLSRSAQHEPVRGYWCRVCETCYVSREGYNDHNGLLTDHTNAFIVMRRKTTDKQYLEISRLEKRLTKLTQLLANPPPVVNTDDSYMNPVTSLSGQKNQRKLLEQSIVTWEEDARVARCPFCQQEFGSWVFRRSHCRLCGRVVCSDPQTECSTEVGFEVEPKNGLVQLDIRICKDCRSTVFSRKDFDASHAVKPADQRDYEYLLQFEMSIRTMLAAFQRNLVQLQDPEKPPSSTQIAAAARTRKSLIDSFGKYDLLAKRIRDLPTSSPTQQKLQKNIHQQASNFLHIHMLSLKSIPKVLKHATLDGKPHTPSALRNGSSSNGGNALAQVRLNEHLETSSQASSTSAVSAMEAEEKELRERLIVLEEQKFFVGEMLASARKGRRFDEVNSLLTNFEEVGKEIDAVNGMLGQLDFEGVYNVAALGT